MSPLAQFLKANLFFLYVQLENGNGNSGVWCRVVPTEIVPLNKSFIENNTFQLCIWKITFPFFVKFGLL